MRKTALLPKAFDEFSFLAEEDSQILIRILALIKDIQRDPFLGISANPNR